MSITSAAEATAATNPARGGKHSRWRRAEGAVRARPSRSDVRAWAAWVLGVSILGAAWTVPGTIAGATLGWIAALWIATAIRSGRGYLTAYLGGVVLHLFGFHWIFRTVMIHGGFGPITAGAVFGLFVASAALQFVGVAVIGRSLPPIFDLLAIRSATSMVLAELLMPRLFPWHAGHTQMAFTPVAQLAGIGGAMAITFLMFWVAEAVVRAASGERRRVLLLPVGALALTIAYGLVMIARYDAPRGEPQEVVIVQGAVAEEGDWDLPTARRYAYQLYDLSREAEHRGSLIVWPEGAIPAYLPAMIGTIGDPPQLPWSDSGAAYLVGGYAFTPDEDRYNAAFAVYPNGEVPVPYFKQVLIPFGEYMPFASIFPGLNALNDKGGVFAAGTSDKVFDYPMTRPDGTTYTLRASPLICYEDLLPSLARQSTRDGAQLLVNLTSDNWFGRSLAPWQHHLIASFRAIETRRYLVRSTTTGLSAVVDPLGRTVASLPLFTKGTAKCTVRLLSDGSPYADWFGDGPWWGLLVGAVGLGAVHRLRVRRMATLTAS